MAEVAERDDFLLQECPTGLVDEDTFKLIYSQFFPQGGKFKTKPPMVLSSPPLLSFHREGTLQ
jgi:hypothetical protein